jgi:hypothetical protein
MVGWKIDRRMIACLVRGIAGQHSLLDCDLLVRMLGYTSGCSSA